jgi:lipid II:glycine glycyltransferase (peptidoglycan interpeptide bridge formation enzyme)
MDEELTGFRANDLLLKLAIEQACAEGCRYYYLGDSGQPVSLGQFKQRFGAEAIRHAEYRLEVAPLTAGEDALKWAVKRAIRFRDTCPRLPGRRRAQRGSRTTTGITRAVAAS